jgi:hypothetical protein
LACRFSAQRFLPLCGPLFNSLSFHLCSLGFLPGDLGSHSVLALRFPLCSLCSFGDLGRFTLLRFSLGHCQPSCGLCLCLCGITQHRVPGGLLQIGFLSGRFCVCCGLPFGFHACGVCPRHLATGLQALGLGLNGKLFGLGLHR